MLAQCSLLVLSLIGTLHACRALASAAGSEHEQEPNAGCSRWELPRFAYAHQDGGDDDDADDDDDDDDDGDDDDDDDDDDGDHA